MTSSIYPVFQLPNVEFLRKQAKEWKKLILTKDLRMLTLYQRYFPDPETPLSLQKIQHIIAVENGFKSWAEVVRHTTPLEYPKALHAFLGEDHRLKSWPAKRSKQLEFLRLVAGRIRAGMIYSEPQFNSVLNCYHSFNDPARLRRDLLGMGIIRREIDGSQYRLA